MATMAQITELRLLVNEPDDVAPYTDEYLDSLIDEWGMDSAASIIWRQKAAKYSGLVDMTESGSSRKLSQLHQSALSMASQFGEEASAQSFTVPIERA